MQQLMMERAPEVDKSVERQQDGSSAGQEDLAQSDGVKGTALKSDHLKQVADVSTHPGLQEPLSDKPGENTPSVNNPAINQARTVHEPEGKRAGLFNRIAQGIAAWEREMNAGPMRTWAKFGREVGEAVGECVQRIKQSIQGN